MEIIPPVSLQRYLQSLISLVGNHTLERERNALPFQQLSDTGSELTLILKKLK